MDIHELPTKMTHNKAEKIIIQAYQSCDFSIRLITTAKGDNDTLSFMDHSGEFVTYAWIDDSQEWLLKHKYSHLTT